VPRHPEIRALLDAVITAMKHNRVWDVPRPAAEDFVDMGAFGGRTMAFAQWLRWVFVPNVERLIASDGPWPGSSDVATRAVREGDSDPAIAALVPALAAFDAAFSRR
jgi:uncharacterized protein YqcC (DUF446 family)